MGSALGACAAGVAIAAGLVVGLVWARGKYRQTSSAVWRENYEAEAAARSRLEAEVAEQHARIVKLESKVLMLTDLATGAHAIEDLGSRMDLRFNELMAFLRDED